MDWISTAELTDGKWWLAPHDEDRDNFGERAKWPAPCRVHERRVKLWGATFDLARPDVLRMFARALWLPRSFPRDPFKLVDLGSVRRGDVGASAFPCDLLEATNKIEVAKDVLQIGQRFAVADVGPNEARIVWRSAGLLHSGWILRIMTAYVCGRLNESFEELT